ncbi:MAG TPA: hypothetical protein VKR60_14200 [Candidatus Sulfotelmatobacter sp.]|nr:hypothetical protein [Candidatus Sulfotelmatobacter sp.]
MSFRPSRIALFTLLLAAYAYSQSAATAPKVAPLPYDPLELATGPTVVPDTPEKRALLLNLLEGARQNSALHLPGMAAFTLKVSFDSTGDSKNTGYGEVEETWLNGRVPHPCVFCKGGTRSCWKRWVYLSAQLLGGGTGRRYRAAATCENG